MSDLLFMQEALALAQEAAAMGEIPVGAIVVYHPDHAEPTIIGRGFNRREAHHDPTAHAEVVAIRQAATYLQQWRLLNCTLYVTLEPCPMCAGAIINARLPRLVYGCNDPKAGAVETLYQICTDSRLNHRLEVLSGLMTEECSHILKIFFANRRKIKN